MHSTEKLSSVFWCLLCWLLPKEWTRSLSLKDSLYKYLKYYFFMWQLNFFFIFIKKWKIAWTGMTLFSLMYSFLIEWKRLLLKILQCIKTIPTSNQEADTRANCKSKQALKNAQIVFCEQNCHTPPQEHIHTVSVIPSGMPETA
jgi:hypothetical protein